jgi:hypothetical protein
LGTSKRLDAGKIAETILRTTKRPDDLDVVIYFSKSGEWVE